MSETETAPETAQIIYEDTGGLAPVVYFDIVTAQGTMNGVIQIELASRTLLATPDGGVISRFISTGRLRCSPVAIMQLRSAIDQALKLLEQAQQTSTASGAKLN